MIRLPVLDPLQPSQELGVGVPAGSDPSTWPYPPM